MEQEPKWNRLWRIDKWHILVFFVTCIGIYARYWWMKKIPNVPISDFQGYYEIALNIYNHQGVTLHGDPVAFQGMFYPAALGMFFRLVGHTDVMTAKYFNLIVSTASLAIFYFMLKRIFKKRSLVLAGYVILSFLPNYIAYNSVLGTEILFTFFVAAIVLVQLTPMNKWVKYPLMGILIACGSLTRPFLIVYPILFFVAEWLRSKPWKPVLQATIAMALCMAIVIAPWTYRNYKVYHVFVPISYNGGYVLFVNNNNNNWIGGWMPPDQIAVTNEFKQEFKDIGTVYGDHPAKADTLYKKAAESWILHHPLEFIMLGFLKVHNTFFNGGFDIQKWTMNGMNQGITHLNVVEYARVMNVFHYITDIIVYVLSTFGMLFTVLMIRPAIVGLFRRGRQELDQGSVVMALNIAFYTAVYFVTEGQPRYDFPVLFFFVVCTVKCVSILARSISTIHVKNDL